MWKVFLKDGNFLCVDTVINSICIILMSQIYDKAYENLCCCCIKMACCCQMHKKEVRELELVQQVNSN